MQVIYRSFFAGILLLAILGGCTNGVERVAGDAPEDYVKTAPLFEGMGDHTHPITTDVRLAQTYFDQGMALAWGFNHAEAARSFREAQKLDPDAPMPYWGEAWVLGPNINAPMPEENIEPAWQAVQKALKYAGRGRADEQAYIQAMAKRYRATPVEDRSSLDRAYADAMMGVVEAFPADMDARALLAEALMDTNPWDYWHDDGTPKPGTEIILEHLETVLDTHPNHAAAAHLYIHAVEAKYPERAEPAADRLGSLIPGAGHLVHMPSHIYIRVGRYADATEANEQAILVDNDYVTQCHAQGLYPLAYKPHNHHFLWYAAAMEGRSQRSIEAARHVAHHVDGEMMRQPGMGTLQHFHILPVYALARFGQWQDILNYPRPAEDLPYPIGAWQFARGLAHTRLGQMDQAKASLAEIQDILERDAVAGVMIWETNSTGHILRIAEAVLSGEIAAVEGDYDQAAIALRRGVALEDDLIYEEPSSWYAPVRQHLGQILLDADRPLEAEAVFRQDLAIYPDNGWSLHGLAAALRQQGETEEAAAASAQYDLAWQRADQPLQAARY